MRRLAGFSLAALMGFVAIGGMQGVHAASPIYTRLRVILSKESGADFASLRIPSAYVMAHYVTASSPGATVSRGVNLVVLEGADPVSATIDVLFKVPENLATPELRLAKSLKGAAAVQVLRINTASAVVADFENHEHLGDGDVSTWVTRQQLVGEGLTIPVLDPRKLVLAFYYPWFSEGKFSSGMWYDKPTSYYRTNDPVDVAGMIGEAAGAGINGFVFSYDGVGDKPQRFDLLLEKASAHPGFGVTFTINPLYWYDGDSFDLTAIKTAALEALQRSTHPSFLRSVDGRPVVFVFGANVMSLEDWSSVRSAIAAAGHVPFYVGDNPSAAYDFDGVYLYNPNDYDAYELTRANNKRANALRMAAQVDPSVRQRLWAATVSPGQNEMFLGTVSLNSDSNQSRKNGERYVDTWRSAIVSQPEWILVTSWNEWFEATHISPSERFGTLALDQTRSWSASYRNPQVPAAPAPSQGGILDVLSLKTKL